MKPFPFLKGCLQVLMNLGTLTRRVGNSPRIKTFISGILAVSNKWLSMFNYACSQSWYEIPTEKKAWMNKIRRKEGSVAAGGVMLQHCTDTSSHGSCTF